MNLQKKLRNKEYRDSFTAEYIYSRIPLKIRAMRERRGLSQDDLGRLAGVKQEWVSRLEDPNYGRLTLSTLLKLASAFDVALNVDFVPYSEILNRSTRLSRQDFDVPSFQEENRVVTAEVAAKGLHFSQGLLAPTQLVPVTPTVSLGSTNTATFLPTHPATSNHNSPLFLVHKQRALSGNEQAPIAREFQAAAG
jgi:transcriptional regulator with XRE-family HTH domain